MREHVVQVRDENNPDKMEELITSYAFDVMYAVTQEGVDSIFLKSQGNSINLCADLALEIEKRLKRQFIYSKMKIFINSKFPKQTYKSKESKPIDASKNPKIISFLDIRFQFTNKK